MLPFQTREALLEEWLKKAPPAGFSYDGRDFEDILDGWDVSRKISEDESYTLHEVTYIDPSTRLQVKIQYKSYKNYPAMEWVAHVRNEGSNTTPIIENILPLQIIWNVKKNAPAVIHYSKGSEHGVDDFMPLEMELEHWIPEVFHPVGGRSSNGILPFFNLATGDEGMILAIGWTGQWKLSLTKSQPVPDSHAAR